MSSAPASSASPAISSPVASGSLPEYRPSSVISKATGHVLLTTSASLAQVTAFYEAELSKGGWTIISSAKTTFSTNITARRDHTGTTLAIVATGPTTSISISTYHV